MKENTKMSDFTQNTDRVSPKTPSYTAAARRRGTGTGWKSVVLGAALGVTLVGAVLVDQFDQTTVSPQAVADVQPIQVTSTGLLDTTVTQPDPTVAPPDPTVTPSDTTVAQPDTTVTQSSAPAAPVFRGRITRTRRS